MSKIAETKALEAYPILFGERNGYDSTFKDRRESYIKGYEEAMHGFLEKACSFIRERRYKMNAQVQGVEYIIEQFKNYMQDESEN